jgi:hypothetical protein
VVANDAYQFGLYVDECFKSGTSAGPVQPAGGHSCVIEPDQLTVSRLMFESSDLGGSILGSNPESQSCVA